MRPPDQSGEARGARSLRGAHLQGWPGLAGGLFRSVRLTIEPILTGVVARLDLDQADVQSGIPLGWETERPGDVDGADDPVRLQVIGNRVAGANLDPAAGSGKLA